jgi:hypothetical protein
MCHPLHKEYRILEWVRRDKLQTRFEAVRQATLKIHSKSRWDKSHNSVPYKLQHNEWSNSSSVYTSTQSHFQNNEAFKLFFAPKKPQTDNILFYTWLMLWSQTLAPRVLSCDHITTRNLPYAPTLFCIFFHTQPAQSLRMSIATQLHPIDPTRIIILSIFPASAICRNGATWTLLTFPFTLSWNNFLYVQLDWETRNCRRSLRVVLVLTRLGDVEAVKLKMMYGLRT